MKSYACAVSGENANPNSFAATTTKLALASSSLRLAKTTQKPKPPSAKQQLSQMSFAKYLHKHTLFGNLDHNDAMLMKEACLSNDSMLRKMFDSFRSYTYTVNLKKDGKDKYRIVLHLSRELDRCHELRLKSICAKHKHEGFLQWLSGETGWRYSPCVNKWEKFIIARLNELQSIVKTCAPNDLLYLFPGEMKLLLWCKGKDLLHCVREIRYFVERAKKKLPDTPKARRLKNNLLRNSEDGPDCLIHWAYHDPVSGLFPSARL